MNLEIESNETEQRETKSGSPTHPVIVLEEGRNLKEQTETNTSLHEYGKWTKRHIKEDKNRIIDGRAAFCAEKNTDEGRQSVAGRRREAACTGSVRAKPQNDREELRCNAERIRPYIASMSSMLLQLCLRSLVKKTFSKPSEKFKTTTMTGNPD